jgi:NADH-quinone oxidoreductase subunit N
MAAANELIMIFIGLEISSIASYILAGYLREDLRATEAALKYFLLGSFATAFLLYGVAWIYGMTGSTHLAEIRAALTVAAPAPSELLVAVAAAMMFAGLAFKVSAWPFQVWTPDVYQGAPAPVAAFLSAGPKAAAFAVFLRVFLTAFEPAATRWAAFVWWSALVSMTLGNLAALVQSNIKRLLAYSSIAHAGYVLVALTAHSEAGASAVMFYLAAYALMNIGAFAMVAHFSRKGERYVEVDDFAGLAVTHPAAASLFAIFLLSLIGVPPTAGFFAKFYVFKAALDADLVGLTVLGLLNSAVGAYYYLRILVVMYMREPGEAAAAAPSLPPSMKATLWICAVGTMLLGVWPTLLLGFADRAAAMVR